MERTTRLTPAMQQLLRTVVVLLAIANVRARVLQLEQASKPASTPFAQPDYTVYHTKEALLKKVEAIVAMNPQTMALEVRTGEESAYKMTMQVVTVELGGLSHSPTDSSKMRLLMDFGEHGREYISSELGLRLMQTLADPTAIKAAVGGGKRGDQMIKLLQNSIIKILPMENPNGRDLVESGKLCERKNGRGVDPNRNWEVDWGKKEKDYDPNEEFPGKMPFSEPEVQAVLDIARSLQPHVWLNIHSGMEAMFTPWDHKAEVPTGAQEASRILLQIHKDLFTNSCVVGSGGKTVGYLAHGTATDYMFERLKVPLPYTWEIYGDMAADYHDCFRMFNPIGKAQVEATINLWLRAIFRLIELLPTHSTVSAQLAAAAAAAAARQQQQQAQLRGAAADARTVVTPTVSSGAAVQQPSHALVASSQVVSLLPSTSYLAAAEGKDGAGTAADASSGAGSGSGSGSSSGQTVQATRTLPISSPFASNDYQLLLNLALGLGGLAVVGTLLARILTTSNDPSGRLNTKQPV